MNDNSELIEEHFVLQGPTQIIEGEEARIAIEGVQVDWSLVDSYPDPSPRRKQRILVIGPAENICSLFREQAESHGFEIINISAEAYERTKHPRPTSIFLEEMQSLKLAGKAFNKTIAQQTEYATSMHQAIGKVRVLADDLKAHLGFKKHGSRRGRNIKTDESRKARYSQSSK